MKVFICDVWSDYQESTVTELQNKIDTEYGTKYVIDEITDNCIYVCKIIED